MKESALGVDWYPRGWVAVLLTPGESPAVMVDPDLRALLARAPDVPRVGIDMPIGLAAGVREADVQARAFVGPRRQSVFLTPPRQVLESETYEAANRVAPDLMDGKKISQQAWALRENIAAVAEIAERDPRLIEVHPEVSFRAMAGAVLPFAKTTWNGQTQRRELLERQGITIESVLAEAGRVPPADVLDAAAAAWSAARAVRGDAQSLPANAQPGQREVIWY